ncbi:MAG: hypothetical protein ACM32O_05345 [Clostridia bacterium]
MPTCQHAEIIRPGDFVARNHFYPRVIDAQAHPVVQDFFHLSSETILSLFCERNPHIDIKALADLLQYQCSYFSWAGTDLVYAQATDESRHMVVLETNSCSSGQKQMPSIKNESKYRGYERLLGGMQATLTNKEQLNGELAVIYDKNKMEASGYASTLSDLTGKTVFLAPYHERTSHSPVRFSNGVLEVRDADHSWHPISFAIRYVTQRPWNRIPLHTVTKIVNPVIACLAGGRNKLMAHKAYELFNSAYAHKGLKIKTPKTICNVKKGEIPRVWDQLGRAAVVKMPYSNAGQEIYIITNEHELEKFMVMDHPYEEFIAQSLIGSKWHMREGKCEFYQRGTLSQNRDGRFAFDLRMVVTNHQGGFQPVALFSRRAKKPLDSIAHASNSWDVFGTNLSYKSSEGEWKSDESRLIPVTCEEFESLGMGLDELVEAYIQTVMSVVAIDKWADTLMNQGSGFEPDLFMKMNGDRKLFQEMLLPIYE